MKHVFKQAIMALLWSSLAQVLLLLHHYNCKDSGAYPRVCKLMLGLQNKD